MFEALMMFIQRTFLRSKIKKITKTDNIKHAKDAVKRASGPIAESHKKEAFKKVKSMLFKDKALTWGIRVQIAVFLITVIIVIMIAFALLMVIGNLAGFSILGMNDVIASEEEEENGWEFNIPGTQPGLPGVSGGLYPKDPIIKNRALLMQILERSADDVTSEMGKTLYPEYLLGVLIRETGGYKILNLMDKNKDDSWLTALSYSNPVCEKGSNCSYVKNGYSHFIGGTVTNGKDTGDPYTMKINSSRDIYDATGGDHALGFVQFEIPYIEGRMTHTFPVNDEFGLTDSSITFIRPNFFYIPDQIYAMAFLIGGYSSSGSIYQTILNDPEYQALEERNQIFIQFMLQQSVYGSGQVRESCLTAYNELMDAYNSGKIQYFDEMLLEYQEKFYNKENHSLANYNTSTCKQYIKETYGVTAGGTDAVAWYGIYSACAGRAAWELMQQDVDEAEKESGGNLNTGGNWLDYIGSGHFAPIGNGKYYSQSAQATIFNQSGSNANYWDSSWRIYDGDGSLMGGSSSSAGCGVFSTAFCITNLTGTVVTVKDLVDNRLITRWPAEESQILKAAQHYGLEAYTVKTKEVTTDDQTFEDWVIKELKDGGLIINVYWGANKFYTGGVRVPPGYSKSDYSNDKFEWYNGKSHYMVIRGFNNQNNNLRVYSSVGSGGTSFESLQTIELSAGRVRKFINTNYTTNYNFIVIKPKGGAGALGGTTGGGNQATGYSWPLPSSWYKISSLFGDRIHPITGKPNDHTGIDIPATAGTPITATKSGTVIVANTDKSKSYGIYVKIQHSDGTYSLYAHMSRIGCSKGDVVNQGDTIGYVGTTGSSTGNHLHFEIYNTSNTRIDPIDFFPTLPLYVESNGKKVML